MSLREKATIPENLDFRIINNKRSSSKGPQTISGMVRKIAFGDGRRTKPKKRSK